MSGKAATQSGFKTALWTQQSKTLSDWGIGGVIVNTSAFQARCPPPMPKSRFKSRSGKALECGIFWCSSSKIFFKQSGFLASFIGSWFQSVYRPWIKAISTLSPLTAVLSLRTTELKCLHTFHARIARLTQQLASCSCLCCLMAARPATCSCIWGTGLPTQVYVLHHWDRHDRSKFLSRPVTVYCHRANQSQHWPCYVRRLVG